MYRSGPLAGTRFLLADGVTRIGRNPDNSIPIQGPNAAVVSLYHAEVTWDGAGYRIRDLGSTNGTYLNGERVEDAELKPPAIIQLGSNGQEFGFVVEETVPSELDRTLVIPEGLSVAQKHPAPPEPPSGHEALLTEAVMQARQARAEGSGNQTMTLMRDVLKRAVRRSGRRLWLWIYLLAGALALISSYGYWKITRLTTERATIDRQIREIETRLENVSGDPDQTDRLIDQLNTYQNQAETAERSLFYRLAARHAETFVTHEIRSLMAEFGAEVYIVPSEFTERVNYHIQQYQGPNRPLMQRALNQFRGKVERMRRLIEQEKLPSDLAYIPLVESALSADQTSAAGAAGPWQITPATARAYGLRVTGSVDERNDLNASTRAACRYLRELILDFGSGSSVMLALAAYNLGPAKVKQAIMKNVRDPIKQRNFWYLYHARALPAETREYVPKVIAAILIGRSPERFGF